MGLLILFAVAVVLIVVVGTVELIHAMLHPPRKSLGFALAQRLPADPAELGLQGEEMIFNFRDGSHTIGWRIEGEDPDGPLIIFTHGWASSRYTALPKSAFLARWASHLVVYDLRGHGDSTAPISRLGTTEADDLLLVAEHAGLGDCPVVLFGSSMGAGVSIVAAARAANSSRVNIAAVIADGPYRRGMAPIVNHLRCRKYPHVPFVWLACAHVAVWVGGFRHFDRCWHAARLPCPLLVLHGTEDPLCDIEESTTIADSAPLGKLVKFDGGGHGNLMQFDERRYLEAVGSCIEAAGRKEPIG